MDLSTTDGVVAVAAPALLQSPLHCQQVQRQRSSVSEPHHREERLSLCHPDSATDLKPQASAPIITHLLRARARVLLPRPSEPHLVPPRLSALLGPQSPQSLYSALRLRLSGSIAQAPVSRTPPGNVTLQRHRHRPFRALRFTPETVHSMHTYTASGYPIPPQALHTPQRRRVTQRCNSIVLLYSALRLASPRPGHRHRPLETPRFSAPL
ncbi:unnamed protein product [Cyclocybe aegerita]|uniref:Uncharacterized protein n=1 Tax=Cyclocybe aegerita TaxID=1973307 RepID=A0A8S0X139_CYCAE|nr:unnamed protein product [Cyclocybe aegerita]